MIPSSMDFKFLHVAKAFYKQAGYQFLEVPWVVSAEAMNITRPQSIPPLTERILVASGEQSFLELMLEGKLPDGPWQTITPCSRPQDGEVLDGLHFSQFYKLELSWYTGPVKPSTSQLEEMVQHASVHLAGYGLKNQRVACCQDEPRDCLTEDARDIEVQVADGRWIEFGSYGIRYFEKVGWWVYGTGLAIPRFEYLLSNQ